MGPHRGGRDNDPEVIMDGCTTHPRSGVCVGVIVVA